ncbi:MAG: HAD-IIB family hydrolase [Mycoplasmoidaceae bacterium]|nr:HAD-IIB family hydrolase [Mycoplasmoidaceae bacterium]
MQSSRTVIEINSIFSSKGMALKYLSSYYGIPLENCIAFGDGDNDSEMLRSAHYGYAMKNGSMSAKLSARFLTEKSNTEDGVAHEINKFFCYKEI